MPDPLRLTILEALQSTLEGITVAAGYRNTVATVEIAARAFDEQAVRSAARPWLGIVPQRESNVDICGMSTVEWTIQILAHVDATKTLAGVAEACAEITNDIRKALYTDPQIGTEGVLGVRITGRQGSEGAVQAAQDGIASVALDLIVKFEESMTAA